MDSQPRMLKRWPGSNQMTDEKTNTTEREQEVRPKDTSFKPGTEGKQRRGEIQGMALE